MRNLKHGLLSLIRKPTKAIMIMIILFIVFSMVFTGVIIQRSISESKDFVRLKLGAVVEYKADYMKAMKDNLDESGYEQMQLSLSTAEEIGKDKRVDHVYITNSSFLESEKYKSVAGEGMEDMDFGGGYFSLKATKDGNDIEFDNGDAKLVDGELANQVDSTVVENPILVSEQFASKNNISIRDELEFKSYITPEPIKMTVVGIYKGGKDSNVFYTQYNTVKKINGIEDETVDEASSIYFKLKDPLDVEVFIEEHQSRLPSEYTVLDAGNSEYEKLTKPLDFVSTIANIFIVTVFVAGAAIIIALVSIFVRDRKFEIGLLLASGEGKFKIVSQFVIEITLVAILAFFGSVLLSYKSSEAVSSWIVENQLIEEENSMEDMFFFDMGGASTLGDVSMDSVADEFEINIDGNLILTLFVINLSVVLIASTIPLVVIMSYKPREALQD